MRKLNSKIITDFISEKGNDTIHKTYVAYTPLDEYICFAVAESYDNDTETNSAKIAVETVLSEFEKKPSLKRLRNYLACANEQILLHSVKCKRKVSIAIILSDYTRMRYAVCGNTKIHVHYGTVFSHISKTQTKHQELEEEQKIIYADSAETHNLIEYLGKGKHIRPYISRKIALQDGSTILVSTSNVTTSISDIELLDALEHANKNQELLCNIEEMLLSKQGEKAVGSYSIVSIAVEKAFQEDNTKRKKRKRICWTVGIAMVLCLLLGAIILYAIRSKDRKKMEEIQELNGKGSNYIEYGNYAKAFDTYETASEKTDQLSLTNWQFIKEKTELKNKVSKKKAVLATIEDADIAIKENDYNTAKRLYLQVREQAKYEGEEKIYEHACSRLEYINQMLETKQLSAIGDMYLSTEDYKQAIESYKEAIELLKQTDEVELRGEIQTKIYDAVQKQKEIKKKEQTKQKKKKKAKLDKQLIQIKAYLTTANKLLSQENTDGANELYQKAVSVYENLSSSDKDTDKVYEQIVALEQSITEVKEMKKEAEEKQEQKEQEEQEQKQKQEIEKKQKKAQSYMLKAAELARKNKKKKAITYYEKALGIYENLNIWDDQVDKIYDAIEELEGK